MIESSLSSVHLWMLSIALALAFRIRDGPGASLVEEAVELICGRHATLKVGTGDQKKKTKYSPSY